MIKSFLEKWNTLTPFAKILAAFLFAVLIVAAGQSLIIKKLKRKNFKLAKNVPASLIKLDQQNVLINSLKKQLADKKIELQKFTSRKCKEIPSEQQHVRVITTFDDCLERCGIQILQRNEIKVDIIDEDKKRHNSKHLKAKLGEFICTYKVQGNFNSFYKFFEAVNDIDEIFSLKDIVLKKQLKNGNYKIFMTFKLYITYLKK